LATPSFFNRRTAPGFIGWSLLWVALQTFILHKYTNNFPVSITDAAVSISFITAACLVIINNFRYYLPGQDQFWFIVIISVVLGVVVTGLSTFVLHLTFRDDSAYNALVNQSWLLRFALSVLLIACTGVISLLWYSLQEQKEKEARSNYAEKMLKEAELFKLRQQLQPHFLFNSLNSISALTISNAQQARHMIQQLSDFLRSTLQRNEQQMITLQEELHQLTLYLDIEKVRFGHRLQTDIQCSDKALPMLLPALLLQPAVENAIKFGLYDTLDDVLIEIKAVKDNENLIISISNPYDEETAQPAQGTGFGLQSIKRRLYLLFARQDLLQVNQQENVFTVTLTIPSTAQIV
jgi:two-component system LytT family sensor kinase